MGIALIGVFLASIFIFSRPSLRDLGASGQASGHNMPDIKMQLGGASSGLVVRPSPSLTPAPFGSVPV